jgi:hypothetical protein
MIVLTAGLSAPAAWAQGAGQAQTATTARPATTELPAAARYPAPAGEADDDDEDEDDEAPGINGGFGSFHIGYGYAPFGDLETMMPDEFRQDLSPHMLLLGGGGSAIINNWVIGGEGFSFMTPTVESNDLKASINGGMGFFNLGYVLYGNNGILLQPFLGIGGGGGSLTYALDEDLDVQDVQNSFTQTEVEWGGFLGQVGLSAQYVFPSEAEEDRDEPGSERGGFVLGLRAGYILSPPSDRFEYFGGDIDGGPDYFFNGGFFRLTLGFGGYEHNPRTAGQ